MTSVRRAVWGSAAAVTMLAAWLGSVGSSRVWAGGDPEVGQQTGGQLQGRDQVTPRLRAIYERGEFRGESLRGLWLPDSSGYVRQSDDRAGKAVLYRVPTGEPSEISAAKSPPRAGRDRSPDGQWIVETREGRLSVRDLSSGDRTPLIDHTTAGQRGQRGTGSDIWYRQAVWSPDGTKVAFVESDESAIRERLTLTPSDPSYPELRRRRFARVGGRIATLRVGVAELASRQTRWLDIEPPTPEFYVEQLDWAGNSQQLIVETLSRFRDRRKFTLVDLQQEQSRVVFEESDEAWVVASQGRNLGLVWIRDFQAFIVISERDGWRHAWLCSRDGREPTLLTPGKYDIIERAVVDESAGGFYFYASPDDATRRYLYRVPLSGSGELERLTPTDQAGWHDYDFSPDRRWAVHTFSTFDSPPRVELVELPGHRQVRVLEDNAELRERVRPLIAHPTEFLQLAISEGVTVDAWLIKPRDFDPEKKYPVLVYVYGEPHAQTVLDRWGEAQAHFHRVIADLGYVVVSIDNRGTPAPKGAAWRRAIFGALGPLSTEEQAASLKVLASQRPFVDLSRVAIWGWSGGGSNTLNALFRQPDLYRVGIAVVPKPQPHLYNAWFQEIFMRTREVNPEGYRRAAPINFAEGLRGKLLIITGSGETNTHIQIIEGLVDRLIELGKPFDYMVYPNRDHGLREGRGTVVHVRQRIIRYLLENLPPG